MKITFKSTWQNIQVNITTSEITYRNRKKLTMHGAGQDTCNGGTHWCFISVLTMELVDQVVRGCTIELPKKMLSGTSKW